MKAFKTVFCTLLIASIGFSGQLSYAQTAGDPDLEIVRQYFAAHHSPVKKAVYITLLSSGIGVPLVHGFAKAKHPVAAGLTGGAFLYYWVRNMIRTLHPTDKQAIFLDDNYGLPAGTSLRVTKTEFTPEEVERVRAYVAAHRHWLFKGSPYWIGNGLVIAANKLNPTGPEAAAALILQSSVPQRLLVGAGVLVAVDALNLLLFGSKFSPSGRFIDSAVGMPSGAPSIQDRTLTGAKPSDVMKHILSLPKDEAEKLLKSDPATEHAVRLTAEIVRQIVSQ